MTPSQLKDNIINYLQEKKAVDLTVINVTDQTTIADYFIIATGKSNAQVKALTEHLEEKMEEKEVFAIRKEGVREARWVVLDYASVIVHIFNDEARDFYNLEKLWGNTSNITKI
ncbi:MAG: ribosome silencing factor [Clostridiales bacterium]|nr:ribosome silencing factor [Clostridiales bacterium]